MSSLDNLRNEVRPTETVVYEIKPSKMCFLIESIFNIMLPFCIIWALVDGFLITTIIDDFVKDKDSTYAWVSILPLLVFFSIHLMPVWMYLGGIIKAVFKLSRSAYIISDHVIYFNKSAKEKQHSNRIPFCNLKKATVTRGIIDHLAHKGDIVLTNLSDRRDEATISNVDNYDEITEYINKRCNEEYGKKEPAEVEFYTQYN